MSIWKCASGGYHSGKDCFEEYGQFMKHTQPKHDAQMVRAVERDELVNFIRDHLGVEMLPWQVDVVLEALVALTPEGKDKKAWEKIHRG